MEVISLDTNRQKVAIIDSYKSFIWNDRYEDLGDFELYIPADAVSTLANIHQDYYIQCTESDRTMIVEKVNYKDDLEDGTFVTISGHSLEAILKRRILWNDCDEYSEEEDEGNNTPAVQINATKIADPMSQASDTGSDFPLYLGIEYLLKLFIIDPEGCGNKPQRKIDDFVFVEPTDDRITSIMMSPCSYQGDNLYDVIKSLCDMYEISFKVTLNESNQFAFELYKGVSHLASQSEHPYVCFSNDFENLLSSDSSIDMSTYKNMAYYKGNGSKYIVNEFDEEEITMEVGFIRIKNNKVYAVKFDYGENDSNTIHQSGTIKYGKNILDWTPDEFNEKYQKKEQPTDPEPEYNNYSVGARVSRTEYGGALLTEDRSFYLTTEWETPPGSSEGGVDDYNYILLYSYGYDTVDKYYRCKTAMQGPWDPTKWERIDVRVSWGTPNHPNFTPGSASSPKEYKDGDIVKYNNVYWRCIEDYSSTGSWDATKWIEVVYFNVLKQSFYDTSIGETAPPKDHALWEECENWQNHKRYYAGNFVTFNDASRTGKITIYRKTNTQQMYSKKKTYQEKALVMYNNGKQLDMYVRKKYKASKKKGVAPTNSKYWTKIKDKYKVFEAQEWEALSDIEVEQYTIYGTVQDSNVGGMDRREMMVDASSVPSTYNHFYNDKQEETVDWLVDDGVFRATVKDMALAELTIPGNRMTKGLTAEIDFVTNFQYRKDYNIGDVIEVRDAYGYIDSVRVKEFIISDDDTGTKCYPTYEAVEASTITTRLLEVNDELLGNTFLVKVPEATRFSKTEQIAKAVKDNTTYYLKSFVKKVTVQSEFEPGKKVKRDLHIVAWVTTDDIYTNYQEQASDQLLKSHPTIVGEPLFYVDVDVTNNMKLPGILFPSWTAPYGVDLGLITEANTTAQQYKNILLANI